MNAKYTCCCMHIITLIVDCSFLNSNIKRFASEINHFCCRPLRATLLPHYGEAGKPNGETRQASPQLGEEVHDARRVEVCVQSARPLPRGALHALRN